MPAGTFLPPGLTTSDVKISSGGTNNYVLTAVDSETIQGEANLTFDGTDLVIASGSLQVRTIDYSDGDNAITIADGGGVTFAQAVDLGSNTLTSTGSMQIRTIDYSDGDLAMTIGDGGTVTFDDRVTVGDVDLDYYRFLVRSAWTSGGAWNRAASLVVGADLTGHSGDDAFLAHALIGDEAGGSIVPGRNVVTIASLYLSEPDIDVDGTGSTYTVTNSATLYVKDAADEATNDYAVWVDAGASRFDGNVYAADMLIVGNGTTTVPSETGSAMTHGILIDMGDVDDDAFQIRNSDVGHGVTDVKATDVFFAIRKAGGTSGGAMLEGFRDAHQDAGFAFLVRGTLAEAADTTESASGTLSIGVVQMDAAVKSTNARGAVAADGNAFVVSNNLTPEFIVKGDGQLYSNETATVATFDSYDDAQLIRTLDHARKPPTMINDKWDEFIKYNEQDLIDARILGDTVENGGMINITGLQRLHNGAIWQGYTRQMELQEEVNELKTRLLALEGGK